MSHFAEIDGAGRVLRVIVADSQEWCEQRLGGRWVQTSYNTRSGAHREGQSPLRKNYAAPGYAYNQIRDAFIPPRPTADFALDEATCQWVPAKARPTVGNWIWDFASRDWKAV